MSKNPNKPHFIPIDVKKNIQHIGLEHELFLQVVLIKQKLVEEEDT